MNFKIWYSTFIKIPVLHKRVQEGHRGAQEGHKRAQEEHKKGTSGAFSASKGAGLWLRCAGRACDAGCAAGSVHEETR